MLMVWNEAASRFWYFLYKFTYVFGVFLGQTYGNILDKALASSIRTDPSLLS